MSAVKKSRILFKSFEKIIPPEIISDGILFCKKGEVIDMDKKRKVAENDKITREVINGIISYGNSKKTEEEEKKKKSDDLYVSPTMCDPLGSYTGIPADRYDVPVQDVDDL